MAGESRTGVSSGTLVHISPLSSWCCLSPRFTAWQQHEDCDPIPSEPANLGYLGSPHTPGLFVFYTPTPYPVRYPLFSMNKRIASLSTDLVAAETRPFFVTPVHIAKPSGDVEKSEVITTLLNLPRIGHAFSDAWTKPLAKVPHPLGR